MSILDVFLPGRMGNFTDHVVRSANRSVQKIWLWSLVDIKYAPCWDSDMTNIHIDTLPLNLPVHAQFFSLIICIGSSQTRT